MWDVLEWPCETYWTITSSHCTYGSTLSWWGFSVDYILMSHCYHSHMKREVVKAMLLSFHRTSSFSERRGNIDQRENSINYISLFSIVSSNPHVFSFLPFKFRKEKNKVFLTTFSSSLFILYCGVAAAYQ